VNAMKCNFFLLRKAKTLPSKLHEKNLAQSSNSSCDDVTSNQSLVSTVDKAKNGWFLFRIIRHGRSKNCNNRSPKKIFTPTVHTGTGSRVHSSPTTSTTTTKKECSATTTIINNEAPVSFVRTDPKVMDEASHRDLLQKLTSTKIMKKHGLDREDSIISYFKQVDNAYNEMIVVVDYKEHPNTNMHDIIDNESRDGEVFYNETNAIDQSISLITMDPALMYRQSIIIDEYSWKSFQSLSENDDDDDDYNKNKRGPNNNDVAQIRYFDI
jgi:hypothetical protein